MPLVVLIPGIGLLGGVLGGLAVGLIFVIWSAIESNGQDTAAPALILGAFFGAIVGGTMGVVASLLRLLAVGVGFGLAGELAAVCVGAVGGPFLLPLAYDLGPGMLLILILIGVLAALQFCRTVLKRVRAEAPAITDY